MKPSLENLDYDIVIIGGGLVGATLVCALEQSIRAYNLKVAVIERSDLTIPESATIESKPLALSLGTRLIYEQLKIWNQVDAYANPIKQVHVSERGGLGICRLSAKDAGVSELGYVIPNHLLKGFFNKKLLSYHKQGVITLITPEKVKTLTPRVNGMELQLQTCLINASLTVLADGGKSSLIKKLGISQRSFDYQQTAITAVIESSKPHHDVAYELFNGKSTIALLPMGDNRSGLVWTLSNQQLSCFSDLDNKELINQLNYRFKGCLEHHLGKVVSISTPMLYPLKMSKVSEQVRLGLVLLGNVAQTIHPVAAQGYNLAIRNCMALAQIISKSAKKNQFLGNLDHLLEYMQNREDDQFIMGAACDSLVKIFSREGLFLKFFRNLGIIALDSCQPLKSRFIHKAMGI